VAQANNDPIFAEDVAPDEEPLEWEATDEGIEISLDCTKCAAYTPFTITWEEILALGAGQRVRNFSRVGSSLHYRHRCANCMSNYRSAEYSDKDAQRESTSTLIISIAEFDAWHRQAVGRARASGQNVPPMQQQPLVQQPQQQPPQPQAPKAPGAPQPAPQPQPQPQQPQPQQQPAQQQRPAMPRVQLSAQDKNAIRQYVRQLAQKGYNKAQIIEARRAFAKELLQRRREEAMLQQMEQQAGAQRQPRRRAPQPQHTTPVVQQPAQYRKMRTQDGRIVLVNGAGQIVKYLS